MYRKNHRSFSKADKIQRLAEMDIRAINRKIDQELRDYANGKIAPRRVVEPNPELEAQLDAIYNEED
jgi:hypothetical protein